MDEGSTGPIDWQRLLDSGQAGEMPANPERWTVLDLALALRVGAVNMAGIEELTSWHREDAA